MEAKHTCSTISKKKEREIQQQVIPHSRLEEGHPHMKKSILCSKDFQIFISKICRGSLHQQPMRRVKISSHYIGQGKV